MARRRRAAKWSWSTSSKPGAMRDDGLAPRPTTGSPKPAGLGQQYGAQFQDVSVVAAYPHRLPYPAALFPFLAGLITGIPRAVLDVGCGRGEIARLLLPYVDRV